MFKNKLKILSYNLFWKALTAHKDNTHQNMEHCLVNNINLCAHNIAIIINNCINKNFDFLSFQEITKNQWDNILFPILKLNSKIINYEIEIGEIYKNGAITLYKKKFKKIQSNFGKLPYVIKSEDRVYQYIIFSHIIYINLQLPHRDNNRSYRFKHIKPNIDYIFYKIEEDLLKMNKDINNFEFIILGDFNNDDAFYNFQLDTYKFIKPLYNFPKTCCFKNNFKLRFDNIFATFGENQAYNLKKSFIDSINNNNDNGNGNLKQDTIFTNKKEHTVNSHFKNKEHNKNWMSDHLPIISIIKY